MGLIKTFIFLVGQLTLVLGLFLGLSATAATAMNSNQKAVALTIFLAVTAFSSLRAIVSAFFSNFAVRRKFSARVKNGVLPLELENECKIMAKRLGITLCPRLGVYSDRSQNAVSSGFAPFRGQVVLSSGLLESASFDDLRGILAHELGHIKRADSTSSLYIDSVTTTVTRLGSWSVGVSAALLATDKGRIAAFLYMLVVIFLARIMISHILRLAVLAFSRRREYRADRVGAEMVGVSVMYSALESTESCYPDKISLLKRIPCFPGKLVPQFFQSLMSTHPPTEERLERLLLLEKEISPTGSNSVR